MGEVNVLNFIVDYAGTTAPDIKELYGYKNKLQ